jgi:hypothetical protein
MVERAKGKEAEKRIRVLEIGCSDDPAHKAGGELFQNPNLQYVGIDLPPYGVWGLRKPAPELLIANAAHMPFPADYF